MTLPNCTRCPLSLTRLNVVSMDPPPSDGVLFIGRDPGDFEDRSGIPFHPEAPAGRKLRATLGVFNLLPLSGFSNLVHCHTPKNRGPKAIEVQACRTWLRDDVREGAPKLIVALGQEAVEGIFNAKGYKPKKPLYAIGEVHGKIVGEWLGVPVMAAYHPSAALRQGKLRRAFVGDMRRVAEYMGVSWARPTDNFSLWNGMELECGSGPDVAIDIETPMNDPTILGVGLSWYEGDTVRATYLPWDDDARNATQWVADEFSLVCHNAKFDIPILQAHGVHIEETRVHDTMLAAYTLRKDKYLNSPLGLKELAAAELSLSWPSIEELGPPEEMDLETVAEYCCQDAAATILLWKRFEEELKEE